MKNFITIPYILERDPPPFEDNYIKYPEGMARHFIREFTKPGDKILDPFSGLGTTLFVAEEMKRIPFGVEYDPKRHQWVAGQMENWMHLVNGDSAKIAAMGFPKMDFCMTSPPYMPCHHKWNPLFAGNPAKAGYDKYLKQMGLIFAQVSKLMKRNAYIVVQADNLPGPPRYTPLVHDLAAVISKSFRPENEIIVAFEGGKKEYRHTHCLVFKKTA